MEYLKVDDFTNYSFLSQIAYSPDGTKMALVHKKANKDNGYCSAIYINKGNGFAALTGVKGSVSSYFWKDDESIIFGENRNDTDNEKRAKGFEITRFYKININGGEAFEAFSVDVNVKDIKPLKNGGYIVLASFNNNRPDLVGKSEFEKEEILKDYAKEKDYQVIDELPYWSDGGTYTNKIRQRLYACSEEGELKPLTPELTRVEQFIVSPCGKYVVFSGETEFADIKALNSELCAINLETGEIKKLLDKPMSFKAFEFWPGEEKLIVSASYGEKFSIGENPNFYILDLKSGELELLTEFDRSIRSSVGTDSSLGGGTTVKVEGELLYFTSVNGFYADVYSLCLKSGEIVNVTNCRGSVEMFDVFDGNVITVGMLDGKLQEVYLFKENERTKLTGFNDEFYYSVKHPRIEHFVIEDSEGVEFDGFVAFPVDYDENEKYPAILNIHGGPRAVYGDVYHHEMQYWANCNYFVLFSNPRGSDGKGNIFSDVRGKYGLIDYDNIMQFVDLCLEKYSAIDENRLGVTGGSYGGYMTNWIIGHNNKFKAAATQRSICNWFSYMIGDLGYFFTDYDILANPWNNPEKLWFHSPLKYIDKAKTPTLIIHSDQDYRCSIPEAYQLFTALKIHGVETRMCIFRGESHGLSRIGKPEHRTRRLNEITDWMNKYLK